MIVDPASHRDTRLGFQAASQSRKSRFTAAPVFDGGYA
jgi:hypothetical protein